MSYHWLNRQELLKKAKEEYDNKEGKKRLVSIMKTIKKKLETSIKR